MCANKNTENENPLPQKELDEELSLEELPLKEVEKAVMANPAILDKLLENPKIIAVVEKKETKLFRGPLPPPSLLKQYEAILPGSVERIFQLTEKEQKHRHDTQKKALNGAIDRDKRGQYMGFTLSILILFIATYFASQGKFWFAGSLIVGNLVALAAVFVLGKEREKDASQQNDGIDN